MLSWVHFGDLHASDEDHWQSLADLSRLIADANRHLSASVDFAYLPGDIANHATPEQYQRVKAALGQLSLRWFGIPGDHDFEPGNLANLYDGLGVSPLPTAVSINGHRCLCLDIVSSGRGGPDFRLGDPQEAWLRNQLRQARRDPERPVVFMHAFPGDLAVNSEAIGALFATSSVACVDTGHTHYNELLNDGAVIYAATRSTGQIEEGEVGFSLNAVDGSVASWRFKALKQPWPFVLITSPADHRLVTDPTQPDQAPVGAFIVNAKVFGDGVVKVTLHVDGDASVTMSEAPVVAGCWSGLAPGLAGGHHTAEVEAITADGATDRDAIVVLTGDEPGAVRPMPKPRSGHDVHSIGAWPEHGLLGSQLGPNKNGQKW